MAERHQKSRTKISAWASEKGNRENAIHFLLVPPRKNTIRAASCKSLIDARIPRKRSNYIENNANQHFCTNYQSRFCFTVPERMLFLLL